MNFTPTFRNRLWGILSVVLCFLTWSCSNDQIPDTLTANREVSQNDREYQAVWGMDGIDFLEATLVYHGKKPELPFENLDSFDEQKHNADFYSYTLRNLTDLPIEISSAHFFSEKGKREINKKSSYITKKWGTNLLEPGQTIARRNLWVWANTSHNRLIITYQAQFINSPNKSSIERLAEKVEESRGESLTFPFQVILKFLR